jgi:hypothetical protein
LKKLAVDESALLRLLHRWREEAEKAGCRIERMPHPDISTDRLLVGRTQNAKFRSPQLRVDMLH